MAPQSETVVILMHKLEFVEEKLSQYMSDNNVRLDQLIDLTKQIAAMSERQSRHNDALVDLRDRLSSESLQSKEAISRLHTRVDGMKTEIETEFKSINTVATNTSGELQKYINRGIGAWIVAALIFGAAQTLMFRWIDSSDKDRQKSIETVDLISRSSALTEQRLKMIERNVDEFDKNIKRIDSAQRDLEDVTRARGRHATN